jgi:membrane protease YdiL (CAAX protease family)
VAGLKAVLALISLGLSLLLWVNGLLQSLERPSVVNDLAVRQLELSLLAAPQLPPRLRPALVGDDPEAALLEELRRQAKEAPSEAETEPAESHLTLLARALLLLRAAEPAAASPLLEQLRDRGDPAHQLLVAYLLEGRARDGGPETVALPLPTDPLLRRLSCEVLGGGAERCAVPAAERRAVMQLIGVTVVPALALLAGIVLLTREAWLFARGRLPAFAPLIGPRLGFVDLILLIAGGFVLIGEVFLPALVSPLIDSLLSSLGIVPPLADGLSVVGLYLSLMAAPLVLLAVMLPSGGEAPALGWLQFRWRPLSSAWRSAFRFLLMALPLVSLAGWLQEAIWGDPGGSNPLLEMVLRSDSALALLCYGFTAVVLAPLFEETIFRGVLLPVLSRRLGSLWGVVLSSAVFGLAHLSIGELPPLFVLGLLLGWLRLSSGRLSASIWLHTLWNALTFSNLLLLSR